MNSLSLNLRPYVVQEGLVYRLTPQRSASEEIPVDLEKAYENIVVRADYSNLSDPSIYFNHEDYQQRMIAPIKFNLNALINGYAERGDMQKVNELASFAYEKLYFAHLEPSYADLQLGSFFEALEKTEEAEKLMKRVFWFYHERIILQLEANQTPSRNDLLLVQESSRLLQDPDFDARYEELVGMLSD